MVKKTSFETGIGFSIELDIKNDWKLELRGVYKGLPLYESLGGKVTAIAFVERPAIKIKAIGNDNDKTVTGPVMIPGQQILRNHGPKGPENCYWFFSAKTIEKLQREFKGKIKIGH